MVVNGRRLHKELGINAGLPSFSWRLTHKTNVGASARPITSRVMTVAFLMLDELDEIILE